MIGESNRFHKLRYPKFTLLALTYLAAYIMFAGRSYPGLSDALLEHGYLGSFTVGLLYAYAFTAAPATAMLLMLGKEQNLLVAGITAGIGALASDLMIFHFVRRGFSDEVQRLSEERLVKGFNMALPPSIRRGFSVAVACILIASPLPTELGVALMASATNISSSRFAVAAYLLHTCGILLLLFAGSLV